jgi:hypothetical protein
MQLSLRQLIVENFRSVRERVVLNFIDTPPGLYYIRGDNLADKALGSNGAGKSTLFSDAIIWVLTGKIARSGRPGKLIENRYTDSTTIVEVELRLLDTIHTITRMRNPNNLMLDGRKVEQLDIDELFRLNMPALRKSILIDQFSEMFMGLRAEAKSKLFVDSLNLDRWVVAADRAAASAKQAERERDAAERDLHSNEAVRAESRDQYKKACELETEFEEGIKTEIAQTKVMLREAEASSETYRTALDNARRLLDKVDMLDQTRLYNDRKSSRQRLIRERSDIDAKLAIWANTQKRLIQNLEQYMLNKCPECGQEVEDVEVEAKLRYIDDEIKRLGGDKVKHEAAREGIEGSLRQVDTQIEQSESVLADFQEAQREVAVVAERSLSADREKHRLSALFEQLKNKPNPFTPQCDALDERIKQLTKRAKELTTIKQEKELNIAIYRFWEEGFREIRFKLIEEVLGELEMASSRYAEMLGLEGWGIKFQTEHETRKGDTAYEFSVLLYPTGEDEPVDWDTYCGGEVQRWQLCVTFALSDVLLARAGLETDFEIIDEPTTHLTPSGIEDLLACLADRARDTGKRIFLIDHNSLDRGVFDGVVSVVKDKQRGTYITDTGGIISLREKARRVRL